MTVYLWFFGQYLFVQNFGLFSPFLETDKLAWFPVLDTICSSGIQSYFAYRAYLLNRRNIFIPITILFLILTSFAATIAVKVIFGNANSLMEADKVRIPELIWLASIMAADILITLLILNGLLRSKTGWAHTDKAIVRLIRITFESQIPPTILAITFMIEFVQTPASLLGSTLQGIQSKLYTVGLMYSLNSRVSFRSANESGFNSVRMWAEAEHFRYDKLLKFQGPGFRYDWSEGQCNKRYSRRCGDLCSSHSGYTQQRR